mmetsp:Transcript_261/g.535  ORF Transcript_261/g.535 Transcript_261/m.535 type:complete len:94 (-) Transcript_261:201-482(-)
MYVCACVRVCVCAGASLFCKRDLAMQGGSLLILDNPLHTEPSMHVCVRVCVKMRVCGCMLSLQQRPSNAGKKTTHSRHSTAHRAFDACMCARV